MHVRSTPPHIQIKNRIWISYYHNSKFNKHLINITKCIITNSRTKLVKACLIWGRRFFTSNNRNWSCKHKVEYLKSRTRHRHVIVHMKFWEARNIIPWSRKTLQILFILDFYFPLLTKNDGIKLTKAIQFNITNSLISADKKELGRNIRWFDIPRYLALPFQSGVDHRRWGMESALFKQRDRSAVPSVGRLGGRLLESSSRESWRRSVRLFGRSTETKGWGSERSCIVAAGDSLERSSKLVGRGLGLGLYKCTNIWENSC